MNDIEHCFKIVQCFHNLCKKKKFVPFNKQVHALALFWGTLQKKKLQSMCTKIVK